MFFNSMLGIMIRSDTFCTTVAQKSQNPNFCDFAYHLLVHLPTPELPCTLLYAFSWWSLALRVILWPGPGRPARRFRGGGTFRVRSHTFRGTFRYVPRGHIRSDMQIVELTHRLDTFWQVLCNPSVQSEKHRTNHCNISMCTLRSDTFHQAFGAVRL